MNGIIVLSKSHRIFKWKGTYIQRLISNELVTLGVVESRKHCCDL